MSNVGDARVQDLPEAATIYDNDHFVMEQLGSAMKIDGRTFKSALKGDKGDIGLTGPKGPQGMNSVIAKLPNGFFAMNIDERGHLFVSAQDEQAFPPMRIDASGHLIYTL